MSQLCFRQASSVARLSGSGWVMRFTRSSASSLRSPHSSVGNSISHFSLFLMMSSILEAAKGDTPVSLHAKNCVTIQRIEHDSTTKYISPEIIALALQNLWRCVARGATSNRFLRARQHYAGQPKIHYFKFQV